MTLNPSTRLGPYEILAPIGAGGMGEVLVRTTPERGASHPLSIIINWPALLKGAVK
jgi:hypothetical protein